MWYNAINSNEYAKNNMLQQKNKDKILILYAGRLLKDKGLLLLIEAYEKLKEKYNNIELIVAGDGPLYNEIKKHINIKLTGKLEYDELMKLYQKAHIFVNPSYSEGMPTAVLEAGLMKCAIIATPVGGTKEIIKNGETGLICSTTVESIYKQVEKLINDNQLINKLSQAVHNKIINEFLWENTTNKVIKDIKFK